MAAKGPLDLQIAGPGASRQSTSALHSPAAQYSQHWEFRLPASPTGIRSDRSNRHLAAHHRHRGRCGRALLHLLCSEHGFPTITATRVSGH